MHFTLLKQKQAVRLFKPFSGLKRLRLSLVSLLTAGTILSSPAYSQQIFESASSPQAQTDIKPEDRLLLDADTLSFDSNRNIVTVQGNVQVFFAGNTLEADKVVYDRANDKITAIGKVRIIEPSGNILRTEEIELSEDFREGFAQSLQIDSVDNTFFAAREAKRTNGNKTVLKNGLYSVCAVCRVKPGRIPTWRIKAEEIIIDDEKHKVIYKNASFEFLGVPIAYVPRFSHVDPRVKQKSGILSPKFIVDSDLGTGFGLPYYYAVDESKDITFTPTYFTKQGLLAEIEWRQRLANGAYTLQLAGIRQEAPEEFIGEPGERDFRGGLRTTGDFALNGQWNAGWDILALSDRTFAEDYKRLTDRVDRFTSNVFLTGLGKTNYVDIRGQYFNILDDDTSTSGNLQSQQAIVHPSIDYDGIVEKSIAGGQLSYKTNLTSLSRIDEEVSIVNGERFLDGASGTQGRASAEAEWKRQLIVKGGHVFTPSLTVRADAQAFSQDEATFTSIPDSDVNARGQVTGGLEWRYPLLVQNKYSSHIFEPIAQIFVSPNETHTNDFLNEDSQTVVLDDTNIFQNNRFAGFDRVEGGTRANIGLTHQAQWTSWLASNFLIGQSFHLAGKNSFDDQGIASIYSQNGLNEDRSDVVGRFGLTALDHYKFIARGRFDNDFGGLNRGDFITSYEGSIVNASLGYTFVNDEPLDELDRSSQLNGSLSVLVHPYWTFFSNGRYDFDDNRFVNNLAGIKFDDNQLSLSLAFFQNFDEDGDRDGEGFLLSLNLRTLGGF